MKKKIKKSTEIMKEVQRIQDVLNIDSSKYLTVEEIKVLHQQQENNIVKDFVINATTKVFN